MKQQLDNTAKRPLALRQLTALPWCRDLVQFPRKEKKRYPAPVKYRSCKSGLRLRRIANERRKLHRSIVLCSSDTNPLHHMGEDEI